MNFNLTQPCKQCPFRRDMKFFFPRRRAEEILDSILRESKTFPCHKTMGNRKNHPQNEHCAGALIFVEKTKSSNFLIELAERLGLYNPKNLKCRNVVFQSEEEFLELQVEE